METKKPATGIRSSEGITSSADAEHQARAGYAEADAKALAKKQAMALADLSQAFKDAFGFELIITPDNAGRVLYGDGKIMLELSSPSEESEAQDIDTSHPFLAILSKVSSAWKVTINANSYLFPSIDAADPLVDAYTITDIGNPLAVSGKGNAYLEGTRGASTDPWTVAVKYSAVGMTPDFGAATWQAEFDATDGWQKKFRYLLAAVTSDGGGSYEVVQRARSHMALILCAVNGRPAYLPTPL